MPVERLSRQDRVLVSAAGVSTSPFSGRQQVQSWGGVWWQYSCEVFVTKGVQGRALSSFFAELQGPVNTFVMPDPSQNVPIGLLPVVNGANQSGQVLNTRSWPVGATCMVRGDLFSLGSGATTRLHQLTSDVVSDASGLATLRFVPPLRQSPLDGDGVEVQQPKVHLRLDAPVPARLGVADSFTFTFTAREVL